MSENLLPCPFCGKPAEARWLPINGSVKKEIFGLCGCNPCDVTFFSQTKFVEGQEKEALSQAIAAWNRRVPPQGGQPAKCPECGSNMTRFGSSDMCGPETITFFNECRRCKKVYPVVQPAEPVEGAPALEKLIEAYEHAVQYTSGVHGKAYVSKLVDAARDEAANRRPSTGEDERVAVARKIAEDLRLLSHQASWSEDERIKNMMSVILTHLPAPRHSDVQPPWAKLRPFHFVVFECSSDLIIRDSNGDVVAKASCQEAAQMICAALNGESK